MKPHAPRAEESERGALSKPASGRGMVAWGLLTLVVMIFAFLLAPLTAFWWLVLIVPIAIAAPAIIRARSESRAQFTDRALRPEDKQRQVLEALAGRGELTATTAALHTALTIDEASALLEELAAKGHLQARVVDGVIVYDLFERDRLAIRQVAGNNRELPGSCPAIAVSAADALRSGAVESLAEPLTEREQEVLRLLASGRTNAEIASDLFVATGTIKAHVNNIYRKLEVRNRTEALARARDLGFLDQ